jgi:hypothetical protein
MKEGRKRGTHGREELKQRRKEGQNGKALKEGRKEGRKKLQEGRK